MSYCRRLGDSDVYMYPTEDAICCCDCFISEEREPSFATRKEAIKHLLQHRKKNQKVPQYAIDRLKREIKHYGNSLLDSKTEGFA